MAKETKVGLLAGLAFIICFAVILANRGDKRLPAPGIPSYLDREHVASRGPGVTGPVSTNSTRPHRPLSRTRATSQPQPVVTRPHTPRRIDRNTGSSAEPLNDQTAVAMAQLPMGVPRSGSNRNAGEADGGYGAKLASPSGAAAQTRLLERRLDELSRTFAGPKNATHNVSRAPSNAPVRTAVSRHQPQVVGRTANRREPTRHKVIAGDTLTKIAAKYYRSRSLRIIDAIFDANRSLLSSPDAIRPGMELQLPVVADIGGPATDRQEREPRRTPTAAPVAPERKPPNEPFRWYQIKKNDRYVSIAREQLGSANCWKEIYELNRDKFPDPGRIREGVRIKLPVGQRRSSGEAGR